MSWAPIKKIHAVVCQYLQGLINYSVLLNRLEYFKVVLGSNMKEVHKALRGLPSVDFLLDDLKVGSVDVQQLININCGVWVKLFFAYWLFYF